MSDSVLSTPGLPAPNLVVRCRYPAHPQIGHYLQDEVLPDAYDYFTGEAGDEDDEGSFGEFDELDEEDDEDDEGSVDLEEEDDQPKKKKQRK